MNPSTPPFHDLESVPDAPLWPAEGTEGRQVFLMPAPDAALFVAFGARRQEVCFVARGSLSENLGPFLGRMAKEEAPVGLYVQPPVPRDLLDKYGAPPPFEGHEPFLIAVVTLNEGVNVMANVVKCDLEQIKIGMKVEPYWHPLPDGTHMLMFQPADA